MSLLNKCNIHRPTRDLLSRLRQFGHLLAVLLVRGSDMRRQQMPQRVDGQCTFDPLRRLVPS